MSVVESIECPADVTRPPSRDRGFTLVEIVISIVLLGLGVAAMLSTLSVTIDASTKERDHANAHAWLQTAADVLYGLERHDCGTEAATQEATVRAFYEAELKAVADNPEGWPADNLEIVSPVRFWDGDVYQDVCYDDQNINLQLITIRVRNLDGQIVESVEVVKG